MTNILILAAGRIDADDNAEILYPTCLAELNGVSVLEKTVYHLKSIPNANYVFALHAKDIADFHLDSVASLLAPDSRAVVVPENSMGSACTALLAACNLDPDQPLLIVSVNELVDQPLGSIVCEFSERELDAGTIVFRSVHPRYSYVRVDNLGFVIEAAQQNPISQLATAGIFWFAKTDYFIQSAKNAIKKNSQTNGYFYLAPVFNELILLQKKIGVHEIDRMRYIPLKTVNQIKRYEQGQS